MFEVGNPIFNELPYNKLFISFTFPGFEKLLNMYKLKAFIKSGILLMKEATEFIVVKEQVSLQRFIKSLSCVKNCRLRRKQIKTD